MAQTATLCGVKIADSAPSHGCVHLRLAPTLAWLSHLVPRMSSQRSPLPPISSGPPKLLDRVRDAVRARHYSHRIEDAYVTWIRRYIVFHRKTHPAQMCASEISQFLAWLAVHRRVSASTQNQALSALLFLYRLRGAPRNRHRNRIAQNA